MANENGNAYALTLLCPIVIGAPPGSADGETHTTILRNILQHIDLNEQSPAAKIPNTYLCRFYVLGDVFYQGNPAIQEHLKSDYLVFSSNFYGKLDPYLEGMWNAARAEVLTILAHCVGTGNIRDAASFIEYIKKCQVTTTFFFNGSTDEPLAQQLKNLYLKQEFSKFAFENQGKTSQELQAAFLQFVARVKPTNLDGPTWLPGAYHLDRVVSEAKTSGGGAS